MLNTYFKPNFLITLLKDNYGPSSKIFFMYKLNKHFSISLDMYNLLMNLKNINYVDSLIVIKTIKHYENFFDGIKYIILFTSFLFEYYRTNFNNIKNCTLSDITITGKLILKILSFTLIKFSKHIDLKNIYNNGKNIFYITKQFNMLTKKIIENLINIFKYKIKNLFFYKKKLCNIVIETMILQGKTGVNIFSGLLLKHSTIDKIKFIKNPIIIIEDYIIYVLKNINIINSNRNIASDLKNIKQSESLKIIKILKNKKINCLVISKNINEFFRYYLNLHKTMILMTEKSSDINRVKALTRAKGNFIGKAKTISSIYVNRNHHILLNQFEELSCISTILIKSNDNITINMMKNQILKLLCLFKIALSDHRLLIGRGYTELFVFLKFKKLIIKKKFFYDKLKISKLFLWFYLKLNKVDLHVKKISNIKKNKINNYKKTIYDYYISKWQSLRTIFLLFWDLININQENKLIVEKPFF